MAGKEGIVNEIVCMIYNEFFYTIGGYND